MAHNRSISYPKLVRLRESGKPVYVYESGSYHWIPTHKIMLSLGYTYSETVWCHQLPGPEGHPLTVYETPNHRWYWYYTFSKGFYRIQSVNPDVQLQKWTGQIRGNLPYPVYGQATILSGHQIRIGAPVVVPPGFKRVSGQLVNAVVPDGWGYSYGPQVEGWGTSESFVGPSTMGANLFAEYGQTTVTEALNGTAGLVSGTVVRYQWPRLSGYYEVGRTANWTYREMILPYPTLMVVVIKTPTGQSTLAKTVLDSVDVGLFQVYGMPKRVTHFTQ